MASKSLTDDVEEFVKTLITWHTSQKVAEKKVIHDPILGTNVFEPHEIALIDLPFCQRLRRISQTDVASLIYPSTNHNRLEHSLGVATIAGRLLDSLRQRLWPNQMDILSPPAMIEVRAAAILHDIGQGPFSHLTDYIMKQLPEVIQYRKKNPNKFSEDKPHEMLSYLIVKSPIFQDYVKHEIISKYGLPEINMDRVAEMIIAAGQKDPLNAWQGNIINGPFDADKLDYLQRDAYFSGLRIGIDLDRLLHSVWLDWESSPRRLKVMPSGAVTLEQILFGKVLLYNTMYHHQKVLAAECAVHGVFEILKDHKEYKINGRRMNRAIDYLYVSEDDILSLDNKPEELKDYVERFLGRYLPKRALVISADTVNNPDTSPGYFEFKSLAENPKGLRDLRLKLVSALNNKYPNHQIWIALPRTPTFSDEADRAKIQEPGGTEKSLRDIFHIDEWLTAYWSNKWKGYVFCPPGEAIRKEVAKKASELFHDEYNFSLNPKAFEQAKIR
ncbi:MAG: HD domain-containing protein [Chloroflexi bacterium]|nr:HD domain-containing protein [Chloroflexota bacterium]